MKKIIFSTFYLLFLSIAIVGCKKEDVNPTVDTPSPTSPSGNPLYSGVTITTSIGGVITDQNGNPIFDAEVKVGSSTTHTNADGIFYLPGVNVDQSRAYVKVNKSGYFLGSRAFIPQENAISQVRIQLLPKTVEGSIDNSVGGTVSITGGATLTFEPGDVSLENGGAYSGTVNVHAFYLDPTLEETYERMPGDLQAISEGGAAVSLATYGMIAVELTGSSGEALNVTSGESVQISMPIASQQSSSAPPAIPLWHFDEIEGNWVEEGEAIATGGNYIGEVSHFSFWNCDIYFPNVKLKLTLECQGAPLQYATVKLTSTQMGVSYGYTNSNGYVAGSIPANETFALEVLDNCGQVIYSQAFTSGTNNIDLGVIQAWNNTFNYSNISGNVIDCSNAPVTNGYISVNQGTTNYILYLDQNGQFNGSLLTCAGGNIDVSAVDLTNQTISASQSYSTGSTVNTGTITACNAIDEFIYFAINGNPVDCIESGANEVKSHYTIDTVTINGYNSLGPNTGNIYIQLLQPVSLGSNTVQYISGYNSSVGSYSLQTTAVNITALDPNPGGYIEGTISGTVLSQGVPCSISGSFRTKNE